MHNKCLGLYGNLAANFVAVAETEDFLNLSSKQVEEWISSDEIIVEERRKFLKL